MSKIGRHTFTSEVSGIFKMSKRVESCVHDNQPFLSGSTALVELVATLKYHLAPNKEMEVL